METPHYEIFGPFCFFLPYSFKNCQQSYFEHPSTKFQRFTSIKTTGKIMALYILILFTALKLTPKLFSFCLHMYVM